MKNLVPVDFNADKEYLIAGLTSDINTPECIYDLIDNSIDAARDEIFLRPNLKRDQHGLPTSYRGYEISIKTSDGKFIIEDNCSGMSRDILSKKSFKTGARSSHEYGIGLFGVGLNRAVFKFGSSCKLLTDTGTERFLFEFTKKELLATDDLTLYAAPQASLNHKMNYLEIGDLGVEIADEFEDERWRRDLLIMVSQRYGIFLQKGLKIKINGVPVPKFGPKLRSDNVAPAIKDRIELSSGVVFYSEAGLHDSYKLPYEDPHSAISNKGLSSQYGWYIVCNDRIILVADRSLTTGWHTTWHGEYNGFIGWAYYVSKEPSKLPWNSKKTGIDTLSFAHRETVERLSNSADQFRAENRVRVQSHKRKKASTGSSKQTDTTQANPDTRQDGNPAATAKSKEENQSTAKPRRSEQKYHSEYLKTIFFNCSVVSTNPKISDLAIEAAQTITEGYPYRSSIFIRTFFELVITDYLKRHKHYNRIKQFYFDQQANEDREFTDAQKRNFSPNLEIVLNWVLANDDVFPADEVRTCKTGCQKFKNHLKKLNGVVHETGVIISSLEFSSMRDDIIPAIQIFLEN